MVRPFSLAHAVLFLLLAVTYGSFVPRMGGAAEAIRAARAEIDRQFINELAEVAERCEQLDLLDEAEQTRSWWIPRYPGREYVFLPPSENDLTAPAAPQSPRDYWRKRFLEVRRRHAQRLFEVAREHAKSEPACAYSLLYEVLREDPDHEEARRILGYRRVDNAWRRPGDQVQSSVGRADMPEYGFAARQYHQITTAHFRLVTDADAPAAQEIARRLEDLHAVWRQVFFTYWSDGATLARRFASGASDYRPRGEKHRVVWFRDREHYLAALRPREPLIEKTLGIYLDKQRTTFVYGDPEQMRATWVHEVTHQLFAESLRTALQVAERQNLWIVEGVALFMESLRWQDGYCLLGGYDADRLQYARYRALNDKFYVPLVQFTSLGRAVVQRDPNIGALYSQAAGVTHFLMSDPELRPVVVRLLTAVYQGRDYPAMLAELSDRSFEQLDKQYADFLVLDDDDLVPGPPVANLYLGHTRITDAGIARVALDELEWLDVGYTRIGEQGLSHIARAPRLRRLTLEHTAVPPQALGALANLRQLEYLDLSGLPVTDEQLEFVQRLEQLESLWLTETLVTDAGRRELEKLPNLKTIDVSRTDASSDSAASPNELDRSPTTPAVP